MGEDAWSIIWNKHDNPRCERCGGFIDVGYFVDVYWKLKNNKKTSNKHLQTHHNSSRKTARGDCCVAYNKSGFSRNESEKKKRKRKEKEE